MKENNKRKITFWNTDSPLTSKRVSVILSSSKDSLELAKAVRSLRDGKSGEFKVSKETQKKIELAE
jgi:hypothetical protein